MPGRVLGKGEARLSRGRCRARAAALSTAFCGPAVEHRMLADREGEPRAQGLRAGVGSRLALMALRPARARASAAAQPNQDQRRGDRDRADPVERRSAARHKRSSRSAPRSPAGSAGRGRPPAAERGRAHRPAAPARSPGCRARASRTASSPTGMICSPSAEREGQQHRPRRTALARNSSGSGASVAAGAFDEDQIAGVEQAGEQREQVAAQVRALTIRRCRPSAAPQPSGGQQQRRALDRATAIGATSHRPQAAKAKLEILPNRVALPSLVRWMPACQAARSAAKKKAASEQGP